MAKLPSINFDCAELGLWRIEESVEQLVALSKTEAPSHITSKNRLTEHLAWRALLLQMRPSTIVTYNHLGAPTITNGYISVSHTTKYAALLLSDEPCGVDIESTQRNFERISSRYISVSERELPQSNTTLFMAALWCAKEAMYKLSGVDKLDFTQEIIVEAIDYCHRTMQGRILNRAVTISWLETDGHLIAMSRWA